MILVWQPQALEDLKSIQHYIAADNPIAAKRIVVATVSMVHDQLTAFPQSGQPGRIEGTRELVVPKTPFIVPYRVTGDTIEILGVHHASQRWPEAL